MNIIKSELYKLIKSKFTWICLIVTALVACLIPIAVKQAVAMGEHDFQAAAGSAVDALFYSLTMPIFTLICAIFTSVFVSNEFHYGTMKNYVSKGFDRKKIYLAKFLACAAFVSIMFIVYSLLLIAFGSIFLGFYQYGNFNFGIFIGVMLIIWLLVLAYIAVFVATGMIFRSNGTAIAINICLVAIFPTLLSAIDYLFKASNFNVSKLWIGGNIQTIATMNPTGPNITMAIIIGIVWLIAGLIGGILMFKKQDIK